MIGDADHSGQHQHGVKESARPASGAHLMSRGQPVESKEIKKVSTSFRGHMLLSFADGTTHELLRGDYPHNTPPMVGEFYPPQPGEAEKPLDEALAENSGEPSAT